MCLFLRFSRGKNNNSTNIGNESYQAKKIKARGTEVHILVGHWCVQEKDQVTRARLHLSESVLLRVGRTVR